MRDAEDKNVHNQYLNNFLSLFLPKNRLFKPKKEEKEWKATVM